MSISDYICYQISSSNLQSTDMEVKSQLRPWYDFQSVQNWSVLFVGVALVLGVETNASILTLGNLWLEVSQMSVSPNDPTVKQEELSYTVKYWGEYTSNAEDVLTKIMAPLNF